MIVKISGGFGIKQSVNYIDVIRKNGIFERVIFMIYHISYIIISHLYYKE